MVDFWVKIEFDELKFVILPVSVLKSIDELVFHTWKTSSMNSFSLYTFFHNEHNEHDLIKCAIANMI